MKPLKRKVLVKPIIKETTDSGLILPEKSKKQSMGTVIAIGDQVEHCKVGDTVSFYEHSGIPYSIDNVEHLFLEEGKEKYKGEIIAIH